MSLSVSLSVRVSLILRVRVNVSQSVMVWKTMPFHSSTSDSAPTSSLQTQPFLSSMWTFLLLASCIFSLHSSSLSPAMCCSFHPLSLSLHLSLQFHRHASIHPSIHQAASVVISSLASERHYFGTLTSAPRLLPRVFLFLFLVTALSPLSPHFNSESAC